MLKILTLCFAFVMSTPLVVPAAVGEEETLIFGTTALKKSVLRAVERHILHELFDTNFHTSFANHLAPYLATVNASDAVTVISRLSYSKLLACENDANAKTTARVLAPCLAWLQAHRDVVEGSDEDLLTTAAKASEKWDADRNTVTQLATHLGVVIDDEDEDEEDDNDSTSSEDPYQNLSSSDNDDDVEDGMGPRQMRGDAGDEEEDEEAGKKSEGGHF